MRFRNQRGTLEDSMRTVVEIEPTEAGLRSVLEKTLPDFYRPTMRLETKKCLYDARIQWDTHTVLLDGKAVGYTDGFIL